MTYAACAMRAWGADVKQHTKATWLVCCSRNDSQQMLQQ